jgi:hypothetical protein
MSGSSSGVGLQTVRHAEVFISRIILPLLGSDANGLLVALETQSSQRGHSLKTDEAAYGNTDSSGGIRDLAAFGDATNAMRVVSLYQLALGVDPVSLRLHVRSRSSRDTSF